MATKKLVTIEATFPEFPSSRMYASARGEGGTFKAAMAAAVRELVRHPRVKGRRFTAVKMTVSVGVAVPQLTTTTEAV